VCEIVTIINFDKASIILDFLGYRYELVLAKGLPGPVQFCIGPYRLFFILFFPHQINGFNQESERTVFVANKKAEKQMYWLNQVPKPK
jgi:hypothetical protein